MRSRNNNKSRSIAIPFAAVVTFRPSGRDVVTMGLLTAAQTFNIVDPNAEDGDRFTVAFKADATGWTVTFAGAQGPDASADSLVLAANGVAIVEFVYSSLIGRYVSPTKPV